MADFPVKLAQKAIASYLKDNRMIDPPGDVPEEFRGRAGTFVSLHKGEELRGCIGTFSPTKKSIAEEIIHNAVSAATSDPRFLPLTESELGGIDISVDVLSEPEKVSDRSLLDARKYGVIVRSGGLRGLLLPDLEGVDTPQQQIELCKRKAGIWDGQAVELFRFTVNRYE